MKLHLSFSSIRIRLLLLMVLATVSVLLFTVHNATERLAKEIAIEVNLGGGRWKPQVQRPFVVQTALDNAMETYVIIHRNPSSQIRGCAVIEKKEFMQWQCLF